MSERDIQRLPLDLGAYVGAQRLRSDELDTAAGDVLEKQAEREETVVGLLARGEGHQQVEIAVGVLLATREGAEQA